jgi:putative SOS response-associated peptidase YedK
MCGRYLLRAGSRLLERAFGISEFSETPRDLAPRFNVAPTQLVPIVRTKPGRELTIVRRADGSAERELASVRWGLIPAWAKDPGIGNRMINARAESVAEKPAFRAAFRSRRCVVPASGFYEWKREGRGPKRPYLIRRRDGEPIGFAGLWESWHDPTTGEAVESCTIITCAPNGPLAELHDRMPVILDPADYDRWLDPEAPGAEELLRPCPAAWLEAVPVGTRVNSPANDDEGLIRPEGEPLAVQGALP